MTDEMRKQIKDIDERMLELFTQRIRLCAAEEGGDYTSDKRKIIELKQNAEADAADYAGVLFSTVFELSRSYKNKMEHSDTVLAQRMNEALDSTEKLFPRSAMVACQGVEGAYSQMAAEKIFSEPNIFYFSSFEGVFSAIDKGLCRYGVLPLENSSAGSVNAIYDLMMKYNFSIVRSLRLKVDHNLLAAKGAKLSDIKEIYSHEQAISQCSEYLKSLGSDVKITACENTAVAARMVAESGRGDIAALSSRACAELYGLDTLAAAVQNQGNNYTRFICISKKLEIYPGADHSSVMLTVPHKPGSLYRVMAKINALNINLLKLESRPIPDRDFEFMFYFDFGTSVYSPELIQLFAELEQECESFEYLGSYSEII